MFNLDGKRTVISLAAQAILENSGLPVSEPHHDNSFALILYRKDPIDDYFYLIAFAGINEPEPMYGPLNFNDFRWSLGRKAINQNPFGFALREKNKWVESIDEPHWQLHINGRNKKLRKNYKKEIQKLIDRIHKLLDQPFNLKNPLYSELWFEERLARDNMRQGIAALPPGSSLEEEALHLTKALEEKFLQWMPNSSLNIGIYLDTGNDWRLVSANQLRPWLPDIVKKNVISKGNLTPLNAFDWVGYSTRPLLLRAPINNNWEIRLKACGTDFSQVLHDRTFSGMCIVPILHSHQQWKCMGIILLTVRKANLFPSHLYLLSRLSVGVSGYLHPLLPIAGYPWWPDAKLRRGGAKILWQSKTNPDSNLNVPIEVVEAAAKDLMPTKSTVTLSILRSGHSGADVFQLKIEDERGIPEVPRVLKIGPPSGIANELRRYYRYVHNKKVGGASRVDIARGFWHPHQPGTFRAPLGKMYGAIVYTLVGSGDVAAPWSQWCKNVDEKQFKTGLELLFDQLYGWHQRTKPVQSTSTVDLMIKSLAEGRLINYINNKISNPSFDEVKQILQNILKIKMTLGSTSSTSVVHGDLHADNVFAILWPNYKIKGVAIIDWGNVRSGRHKLSDISKLMVDIVYRVNPNVELEEIAFQTIQEWGKKLGCGNNDWKIALINQISRILFYKSEVEIKKKVAPYLNKKTRKEAWKKLKEIEQDLVGY